MKGRGRGIGGGRNSEVKGGRGGDGRRREAGRVEE